LISGISAPISPPIWIGSALRFAAPNDDAVAS
jgi:hypothetical protein